MPGKRCFGGKAIRMTARTELSMGDRLPLIVGKHAVVGVKNSVEDLN
jgi:hypothetical protein